MPRVNLNPYGPSVRFGASGVPFSSIGSLVSQAQNQMGIPFGIGPDMQGISPFIQALLSSMAQLPGAQSAIGGLPIGSVPPSMSAFMGGGMPDSGFGGMMGSMRGLGGRISNFVQGELRPVRDQMGDASGAMGGMSGPMNIPGANAPGLSGLFTQRNPTGIPGGGAPVGTRPILERFRLPGAF